MDFHPTAKRALKFYCSSEFIQIIPSLITSLRIVIFPHLVYSFNQGFTPVACALLLLVIGTDFADGRLARKLGVVSIFGAYLDSTVDFIFILGLFGVFVNLGLYSNWILAIMLFMYLQFIITNLFFKQKIYDPIAKYYGSLLFGGIGLTLLFPFQLTYSVVTYGIVISTLTSLISRLTHFYAKETITKKLLPLTGEWSNYE